MAVTYTQEQARQMFRDFMAFTMQPPSRELPEWIEVRHGSIPLCPEFEETTEVETAFLTWLSSRSRKKT